MASNSLVSICIPNYNNAKYIDKTIKSIIDQSYKNIEIVISDNASTDNSEEVIHSFNDPRIVFYKNSKHLNSAEDSYNAALERSSGELVAIYHSDDLYDKNIVLYETEFLNNNPLYAAVFALADKIDERGINIGSIWFPRKFRKGGVFNFYDIFMALLRYGYTPLICPSVMCRRSIFKELGLFSHSNFGTAADTEMWLRILRHYPIGIIGKKLVHYRVSRSQGSMKYNYLRTKEADFVGVAECYLNCVSVPKAQAANLKRWFIFQKGVDNIYRSMGFFLKGDYLSANELINKTLNMEFIIFSFKSIRKIKYLIAAILIFLTTKTKLKFCSSYIIKNIYYRINYTR